MSYRNKRGWSGLLILLVGSALLLMIGCESKSRLDTPDEDNFELGLTASPTDIDLGNSAVVEATLLNNDNPVYNEWVRFQVTPETIGSLSPESALTNADGLAATMFTPAEIGDVVVTASYAGELATATNTVSLSVGDSTGGGGGGGNQNSGPLHSIYLSADSINLVVSATGGIETAWLHATGYDIYGNPVGGGIPISFVITNGPGGGEHLDTVGYGPYHAETDEDGMVHVTLTSGTVPGTIRIRAYSASILSNAAQALVSAGPPAYIAVAAHASDDCNVPYWNTVNEQIEVVAVVSDVYHNPVNDSTVVYFTTDEGTMKSHELRTQDLEGIAKTLWISGYSSNAVPTPDGKVWVIAETAGGTVKDSSYFYNTTLPVTITVEGFPTSLPADGKTEAVVYISAWDLNGWPVDNGVPFEGDATFATVPGGTFEYVCGSSASFDRVKIKSAVLDADYSTTGGNDDGIGAVDYVTWWSGGATWVGSLQLTTGNAYSGNSSVGGQTSISLGETARLNVTIKDRFGNPLGDHTVVMTPPVSGVAGGTTQNTNAYGEAFGYTWTPSDTGSVNVYFTDTDPRGGIILSTKISVGE